MPSKPGSGGGGGGGGGGVWGSAPGPGRGRGSGARAGGGQQPFNLGAFTTGELLGMYNNQGTLIPGSGGSPGGRISRAGERAAVSASNARLKQQSAAMYADIDKNIRARNPGIQAGYDNNTAALRQNAVQRRIAGENANATRDANARAAAVAMGLASAPVTENTGADATQQAFTGAAVNNAESWAGYNQGAGGRAVERNNAVGDAFIWEQGQQAAALDQLLTVALSGLGDISYGGSGGSAAKLVGGLTTSQKLNVLGKLSSAYNTGVNQDLSAARLDLSRQKSAF